MASRHGAVRIAGKRGVANVPDLRGKHCRARKLHRALRGEATYRLCFLCSPLSWTINATTVELAGGSSPDIHYELEPHPPWRPGTAR